MIISPRARRKSFRGGGDGLLTWKRLQILEMVRLLFFVYFGLVVSQNLWYTMNVRPEKIQLKVKDFVNYETSRFRLDEIVLVTLKRLSESMTPIFLLAG